MNNKVRASFTIEAVFVLPIVLLTIVSIIYLSFYLHDYNRIQVITDQVLHKATFNLKHEAHIGTGKVNYESIKNQGVIYQLLGIPDSKKNDIEDYLMMKLSRGLFATKITDVHVQSSKLYITIRVEGKFLVPIKGLRSFFPSDKAMIVEAKAAYHNPAEVVRISEIVLDTGSKIKGMKELKEKIGKLLP